jgi:hypothetical protein
MFKSNKIQMNYPLLDKHERQVLNEYKQTYTRLLVQFYKAQQTGQLPPGFDLLVISVNTLERQLPALVAFSARKHIDLAWDPSLADAYGLPETERRRA